MVEEFSIAHILSVFYEVIEPYFGDGDGDFVSYVFSRIATRDDRRYEMLPEEEEILGTGSVLEQPAKEEIIGTGSVLEQPAKEESGSDTIPVHHIGVQYPEEEEVGVDDDEHVIDIPAVHHIGFQYPSGYGVVRSDWLFTLGDNPYIVLFLFTVGAICAFVSPVFYIRDIVAWSAVGTLSSASFVIMSSLGLAHRDHSRYLRQTHTLLERAVFIICSAALSVALGAFIQTSQEAYGTFMVIGVAVFCLMEIAQPSLDYGILQLFVCLPLQIAIVLHGRAWFHLSYIPATLLLVGCLVSQLYFVQYFDERYAALHASSYSSLL